MTESKTWKAILSDDENAEFPGLFYLIAKEFEKEVERTKKR